MAHPEDHAVVDWLTRDAYSRNGDPTRLPHSHYYPEDEWHEAILTLIDTGYPLRTVASVLNSKAARHAADCEADLAEYCINKGIEPYYLGDVDDPYITEEDVERAREEIANLPRISTTGLVANVRNTSKGLVWEEEEVDGARIFHSVQAALASKREAYRTIIAELKELEKDTYKVGYEDVHLYEDLYG